MTDTSSSKSESAAPATLGEWAGVILTYGMFAIAGLMGLLTFYAGLRLLVTGEQHWGVGLLVTAMGVIFASIGIGFFYFQFFQAPAMRARRRMLEARYPGQPWMLRRDWAARRVTDSVAGAVIFMWVWCAGWWGAILFIWNMNRDKIIAAAKVSWWEAAMGLVFPLGGLAGLAVAVSMTRTWLRFGRSVLRIDTLPGRLGDRFRGTLEANFQTRPARLEAELICEQVTWLTRRRNGKTSRERVSETVWSETHALDVSRIMLGGGKAAAKLPINLPLPADQPPCGLDDNDEGIVWRITVSEVRDDVGAKTGSDGRDRGPPYSATFEVPVFGR